jgi:hypothetical protein
MDCGQEILFVLAAPCRSPQISDKFQFIFRNKKLIFQDLTPSFLLSNQY